MMWKPRLFCIFFISIIKTNCKLFLVTIPSKDLTLRKLVFLLLRQQFKIKNYTFWCKEIQDQTKNKEKYYFIVCVLVFCLILQTKP